MRRPDFVIAGTQKAGTTWLRDNLFAHPCISGSNRQIHFFDRHYEKGLAWYCRHFERLPENNIVGEKTTEYFDTATASSVAERLAKDCPDAKVVIVLREPVARAFSALKHMVTSGLEPLPKKPDDILFLDRERPEDKSYRYIERGFYARQIESFRQYIPDERLLILIFEEDIIENPQNGMRRLLSFLSVDPDALRVDVTPVNARRLSRPGIQLMNTFRNVPYARSLIWRLDVRSPFKRWQPEFSLETRNQLEKIFAPENELLYQLLGRRISKWEAT